MILVLKRMLICKQDKIIRLLLPIKIQLLLIHMVVANFLVLVKAFL